MFVFINGINYLIWILLSLTPILFINRHMDKKETNWTIEFLIEQSKWNIFEPWMYLIENTIIFFCVLSFEGSITIYTWWTCSGLKQNFKMYIDIANKSKTLIERTIFNITSWQRLINFFFNCSLLFSKQKEKQLNKRKTVDHFFACSLTYILGEPVKRDREREERRREKGNMHTKKKRTIDERKMCM